ncbi:hypothetical protein PanWU01x14_303560 [Parasponia andersonii]|uniref:Transposase, Ptta/En/Spm, plant n=1 Tax=Parasponia andersonii TaxID=3476 RepID=A0A2P5ASV7_PARAD|nr:hypothetical protein PanWU01x14_303560 [Parasponia andersonii]
MSGHGSTPLETSAASGSNSGDDRHDPKGKRVEFCEKTGKPILDHNKMFLNILAKTIRDTIPASTPTWKDVKKKGTELISNWIESMMAYLWDWRNMMRNHFMKMGGKRDIAFIKANPYKNVPFDQWNILCDRFGSQEFEDNLETGELMSPIDYFKSRHLKPSGWRNEYTEEKYAEMVTSRVEVLTQTHSRAQSELGDGFSSAESQLAEKDTEHAWRIDETQRQMAEKEVENQRRLEETQ